MIGETLKYLRVFNDYTMVQLSEGLGLSQSYISEIETNRKQPTLQVIDKYADFFDIKPSTIMLFSESLDRDTNLKQKGTKQRMAYVGMKLLRILEKVGELENE